MRNGGTSAMRGFHSHWDPERRDSDETACRLLRYVGIKLRGMHRVPPSGRAVPEGTGSCSWSTSTHGR